MPALAASRKTVSKNGPRSEKADHRLHPQRHVGYGLDEGGGQFRGPVPVPLAVADGVEEHPRNGSLISGSSLSVSAARAAATPSAVAPTLSVMSQLSSSVLTTRPYVSRACGRITVTMDDSSAPTSRRPHIIRLAVFAAFLVVLFYLLAVKHVVNIEDVRRTVRATGRRRR